MQLFTATLTRVAVAYGAVAIILIGGGSLATLAYLQSVAKKRTPT